ncbi:MAG TPA: FTR1 family protein [Casimicrobiaceae bacterium]|nr:FTR1 family protein [Casimicrobiaceae bacterium]
MLAIAILVFREVLEAALVVSVVFAATRGVPGRERWISAGIAAGVLGAVALAAFAGVIANAVEGMGQELLNASVLFAAVVMIAWHAIWMASHGREITSQMKALGSAVSVGRRPLTALTFVVALAVLREGSEVVLFLYAQVAGGSGWADVAGGIALGIAGGCAVGFALYFGLLRIPVRYFFTATNWLLLLLAAGMASQAARFLVQADLLPPLGPTLWDTSGLLSDRSLLGQTLHALVGYDARPAGVQVLFYVITGGLIAIGMRLWGKQKRGVPRAA